MMLGLVMTIFPLFLLLNFFLVKASVMKSSLSPIECGFSTLGKSGKSYGLFTSTVMVVYIVFELEIVLLLISISGGYLNHFLFLGALFLMLGGFFFEWKLKVLSWSF